MRELPRPAGHRQGCRALLPDEAAARTRTLALLEEWSRHLDSALDADDAFDTVRGGRSMRRCATGRKRFPLRATRWNAPLTFMEQAFEDGQEMVVCQRVGPRP